MATWKFGSTDLTSLGVYDVIDFESANGLPDKRGDNPSIPLREGRVHTEKLFDERTVTLGMYLKGSSQDDFEEKLAAFKLLFGNRNRQYLQRTMSDGSIVRALAEVTASPKISQKSSNRYCRMTVNFLLAEPFFRSTGLTSDEQTISASPTEYDLTNIGTAAERHAVVTFTGPLDYPKLTNLTNGIYVGYNDAIANGVEVVIDCDDFTCMQGTTNYLNKLVHAGDAYFFVLEPGVNELKLETNTTGGKVKVDFYAPYL